MKRRQFSRIILVGLPIASMLGVISLDGHMNKGEAQQVGKKIRRLKYKNKDVEIEEGGDLDEVVKVKVKGNKRTKDFEAMKHRKNNKSAYMTGYFPFGEEFNSMDDLVQNVIDSGVIDID